MKKRRQFNWKRFGADIKSTRGECGLRSAARALGIHHATWCRAEQGKPIEAPDFVFLCDWMSKAPAHYLKKQAPKAPVLAPHESKK